MFQPLFALILAFLQDTKNDFAQIAGDYSSRLHAQKEKKENKKRHCREVWGRQTAHFHHEMHFYGCEGLTWHFQPADPMHSKAMRQDIKKRKKKKDPWNSF